MGINVIDCLELFVDNLDIEIYDLVNGQLWVGWSADVPDKPGKITLNISTETNSRCYW